MSTTPITVEEALTEALVALHDRFAAEFVIWADDDAGIIAMVNTQTGDMVAAQVHDSGIIEYWATLPEPPPMDMVLETLVYVTHDVVPPDIAGSWLVGVVDWGGGGGDFLPNLQ